jgi:hypothetical protein
MPDAASSPVTSSLLGTKAVALSSIVPLVATWAGWTSLAS